MKLAHSRAARHTHSQRTSGSCFPFCHLGYICCRYGGFVTKRDHVSGFPHPTRLTIDPRCQGNHIQPTHPPRVTPASPAPRATSLSHTCTPASCSQKSRLFQPHLHAHTTDKRMVVAVNKQIVTTATQDKKEGLGRFRGCILDLFFFFFLFFLFFRFNHVDALARCFYTKHIDINSSLCL
jgi:hypothetical protein